MASKRNDSPAWRQFEQLVARIEADARIRAGIGTATILVTLDCRKSRPKQDVTWIEQLATKKTSVGAARTIAVSASGFSNEAKVGSFDVVEYKGGHQTDLIEERREEHVGNRWAARSDGKCVFVLGRRSGMGQVERALNLLPQI
jgi:hypothetical protein